MQLSVKQLVLLEKLDFPDEQSLHDDIDVCLVTLLYFPFGHNIFVVAFGQYEPGEHALQFLDPSDTEMYPGKQLLHVLDDDCLVRFPYFPNGHLAHIVLVLTDEYEY